MNLPAQVSSGADIIEAVLAKGDLKLLTPHERNAYLIEVCRSLGLNPLTRPFEYIVLNGKLTLYAKRDAADQLRKNNRVSIEVVSHKVSDGVLTVHVKATDRDGRTDEDFGVVALPDALKGELRANAFLKAVTKAKRRVTLSICGLGLPDESEIEDIPPARVYPTLPPHNPQTGEVEEQPSEAKGEFIEAARDHIRRETDYQALGAWWNSDEQKRARRDFELNEKEVDELKTFVIARRDALQSGSLE